MVAGEYSTTMMAENILNLYVSHSLDFPCISGKQILFFIFSYIYIYPLKQLYIYKILICLLCGGPVLFLFYPPTILEFHKSSPFQILEKLTLLFKESI